MADKSPARAKGQAPRQKRRWFLFCRMRAYAVFSQALPFPPRLFAEREEDGEGRLNPGRFCLRRLPSCPGNVKAGLNHQLNGRWSAFFWKGWFFDLAAGGEIWEGLQSGKKSGQKKSLAMLICSFIGFSPLIFFPEPAAVFPGLAVGFQEAVLILHVGRVGHQACISGLHDFLV